MEPQAGGTHHHAKPGDVRVEPEAEYLFLDAAFAVKGGLRTTLEIIHLLTSQPQWDAQALERVKDIYRMFELNTQRNLELLTHDKVNHAVFETGV